MRSRGGWRFCLAAAAAGERSFALIFPFSCSPLGLSAWQEGRRLVCRWFLFGGALASQSSSDAAQSIRASS
jgi:hypothetical protein